ncbi:lactonase family protein [Mucilaginibacter robiniae]|uniref:Lactonase family protein n=1 Tax=Mucilaginibacter robiniae TaxID=2728022 RepID=A0A7L5E3J7_9SPHI|nr:lactonase family protein [Mucilaginibacter robiniae]QJD95353.1 lactonase family protein [Mucilaginibacter robiniae]
MKKLLWALLLYPVLLQAQNKPADNKPAVKSYDLLVGTYTTGASKGIYVYRFYTERGRLAYLNEIDGVDNPSYLCVSDNHKFIYSVNEVGDDRKGSVSAFSFEPKTGKIDFINKQPSGAGPCYISVDKAQKNVFSANYAGGSLSVFPLNADGSLKPSTETLQDQGQGPNKERQDKPHVHTAVLTPDEKYVMFTDLGTDKVNIYRYKASARVPLSPSAPAYISVDGGEGPRHIDFTPNHKYMYLITEMGGHIYGYNYDDGKLKHNQTVSIVPDGYTGQVGAADIHVSPDGRFLYATNRGDANEIIVYSINQEDGQLSVIQHIAAQGATPRNFVIDPTGNFLLVANQKGNNIVVFRIDKINGRLISIGVKIDVDSPVCLKFVPVS